MIDFFLGDADAFRKHVQGIDFKTLGKMNQILVAYMRNVLEKKPAVELPDVYPADPTPLRKAVLDKLSAP
ncbi:MAG: hypothetical protein QOE70_921 [Chthoniobacter sp.]|jgi:hypothetical protein|nr:hypothetical protein [Chthoniobacter sp.]